jgi:EmrB/QacA subfamily drug resistance transporter
VTADTLPPEGGGTIAPHRGAGKSPDPSRLTPRLRGILAIVLIATMLDLMDAQITNIAAPSIVHEIGGGESLIKWLGASYQLAIGTFLVVGGRLGDRYGKRRLYLIGITGFIAASALCGLSVNPFMIISGRLIQGAFGALLIPQGISIIMATFSREQRPRAFGAYGPILGVSVILGPIVGGFIIAANIAGLDWRPVFLINIVVGGVGLIAAVKLLPHDKPISRQRIDAIGSGLLGLMMLGLIFGLIQGSTSGWTAVPIASLAAGAALFAAFAARQRLAADPLIKPSLLKNRGFTSGLTLALAFFAAIAGLSYVVSLFFQLALHYSPDRAAISMTPLAFGFIGAAGIARPFVQKLGRALVVIGLAVTLVGAFGLWATVLAEGTGTSGWLTVPSLLVLGLGMGAVITSLFDVAVINVEHDEAGSASGSLSAVQQLASAIGAAVVTTVYFNLVASRGGATAMTVSVFVVMMIIVTCLALVWLLPRTAAPRDLPNSPAASGP